MHITSRSAKSSESDPDNGTQAKFYAETTRVTITLNHFGAATAFALFASIVFGITHRETTRDMIRYGLYCFGMFLGGVIAAGWAMWLLRR